MKHSVLRMKFLSFPLCRAPEVQERERYTVLAREIRLLKETSTSQLWWGGGFTNRWAGLPLLCCTFTEHFLCCFIVSFTWLLCVCNNEYYVIKISVFEWVPHPHHCRGPSLWFSLKMWIQTWPCCISEQLQCCVSPLSTSRTALECGFGRGNGLFCQTTACSTTKVSLWKGTWSVTVVNSAGV